MKIKLNRRPDIYLDVLFRILLFFVTVPMVAIGSSLVGALVILFVIVAVVGITLSAGYAVLFK